LILQCWLRPSWRKRKKLSLLGNYELFSPSNVLEETAYKIIILTISDMINSNKYHKIKKAWERGEGTGKNGYFRGFNKHRN